MIKKTAAISFAALTLAAAGCSTPLHTYQLDARRAEAFKNTSLAVFLASGQMQSFTHTVSFNPTNFTLANDECKTIALTQTGQPIVQIPVKACYLVNKLLLDPRHLSNNKMNGAVRFDYNPLWRQGYTYRGVTTRGRAKLTAMDVTIKILNLTANPGIR